MTLSLFILYSFVDVEITDEEAEKIFILKDAFELLKTKKSLN